MVNHGVHVWSNSSFLITNASATKRQKQFNPINSLKMNELFYFNPACTINLLVSLYRFGAPSLFGGWGKLP
jgi:hypothetical protein